MPDLSNTVRWVDYAPDLLGNRDSDSPFYFRFNGSMSKEQLRALREELRRKVGPPLPAELGEDATEEQKAAHAKEAEEHTAAVTAALVERDAAALEPYVKLGDEPLTVDGKRIGTLREYLEFTMSPRLYGLGAFVEVQRALLQANTMEPQVSFSSGRSSGGSTSTGPRRLGGRAVAR